MTTETEEVKIPVEVGISHQTINDLFIAAVEGGINYWAKDIRLFKLPETGLFETFKDHPTTFAKMPAFPNGVITLQETDTGEERILNCAGTVIGLEIMAKKYPQHFANILEDNWDAITADVFFQCCVFQETIYG